MRKGISILLLCLSFNALAVNELLYMEKAQFQSKSDKNRIIKKYRHPINSTRSILEVLKIMLNSGKYQFVELNTVQYEDIPRLEDNTPIDQDLDQLLNTTPWHFTNINAHKAAGLIKNPKEITVAVCDSGYEEYHGDLQGRSVPGFSLIDNTYDTSPNTHHGTMVSGIIVGRKNSITNSSGIAPFVKILPLRITTKQGSTTLETIVNCIKLATDRGAKVVNVSFTGVNNDSIEAAGKYARERGTLVVYSAGNQGRNRRFWPDHKNVFIIGGIQQGNTRWNCNRWYKLCGSNFGEFVDVVAPARDVFTTRAYVTFGGDTHSAPNGTSFAAPIVSAVAALVYSVNPNFTPDQVENIISSTTQTVGSGSSYVYGHGLVDAEAAVKKALSL
jgi:thermitase